MYVFDENQWRKKIADPLWYKEVPLVMKELLKLRAENETRFNEIREDVYRFFETELAQNNVRLGEVVKDFDSERVDIDTIVIHHTHGEEGVSKERLSAMELLRLYATYFSNPTYEFDKEIKDKPIYSGHYRDGKQVFYPYHWMIRKDGLAERLLEDGEVGWHSGDWKVNCRSVAIAFDANYENSRPSDMELQAAATIIKNYKGVPKEHVVGHREVNTKTTCPSNRFLNDQETRGWKEDLLSLI